MGCDYDFETIVKLVVHSMEKLKKYDADLLDINVNERSISHKLAEYLQLEFPEWNVDCEYNRKMLNRKTLNVSYTDITDEDIEAKTIYPDIIVHHRLTDDNLLVIEMKKNGIDTSKDEIKLKAFTGREYDYHFGLLLVIKRDIRDSFEMKWFAEGKQLKATKRNLPACRLPVGQTGSRFGAVREVLGYGE